jgi:ribose 5-phosphate isomerase B
MLALGQRLLTTDEMEAIVEVWLATPFQGGRHARRIAKLDL